MHQKTTITTLNGNVQGLAPLVISASRATDIPAFHSAWLMHRLRAGYCAWVNPFNRNQRQYISFEKCKVIVFWSKNPAPLVPYLDEIADRDIKFYFQFTVNDHEKEGIEPNVPSLERRIETFARLSEKIGSEKVIWRYDPIFLTPELAADELLERIARLGNRLSPFTQKLVFSFIDINGYKKVSSNLGSTRIDAREPTPNEQKYFAKELQKINASWPSRLELATCAEGQDFSVYNIQHNKCIDDRLICRICKNDSEIQMAYGTPPQQMQLLPSTTLQTYTELKDKGQREVCGCAPSKDIGAYNTCLHLCTYCYANHSETAVKNNCQKLTPETESLIF